MVLLGWVFVIAGCGDSSSSPGSLMNWLGGSNSVVSADPSDGIADVPLAKTIAVTFEEEIVLANAAGVTLTANPGDIPISVTAQEKVLLIDPDPLLEQNHSYTIRIPVGTIQGMQEEFSFSFTTVAVNSVVSTDPSNGATGVSLTKTIAVTCQSDVLLGDTSGVTLTGNSGAVPVTVTAAGANLLIDPVPALAQNCTYTVTIPAAAIRGVEGGTSFSFTTIVSNSVVSIDPSDGGTDVPVTKTFAITCQEEVLLGDTSGVTLSANPGAVTVTVTAQGNALLIDPAPLLQKSHTYTVTVPAGAIRGVGVEVSFSFTTVQIEFVERTGIVVSDVAGASIGRSDTSNNITVSESGIIHVVWKVPDVMAAVPNPQDGIYYSRSIDGGASFTPSVKLRGAAGLPTAAGNRIEPEITCSGPDNVWIAYPTSEGRMEVVRSTDSGAGWGPPLVFGQAGTLSEQKHITADGDYVYISSNDGDMPQPATVDNGGNTFIRSTDAGLSFQSAITGLMGYPLHALLVNPLNRDVYILGTEISGDNIPTPVFYVKSTDHGATFENPVSSGQNITHAGYCFDRSGRIIIVGRTGTLLIGDMNTGIWSRSEVIATSSQPLQSTMAVDGDNTIYRVGTGNDSQVHVAYSVDGGNSFIDEAVENGAYPNAASSVNMSGIAMVYSRGGVIYYAYRKP